MSHLEATALMLTDGPVLLIDADPGFAAETRALLGPREVAAADSIPAAASILAARAFSLVVLGPSFGTKAGVDSARTLKAADPGIAVVMVANIVTNRMLRAGLRAGLADVVDAPLTAAKAEALLAFGRRGTAETAPAVTLEFEAVSGAAVDSEFLTGDATSGSAPAPAPPEDRRRRDPDQVFAPDALWESARPASAAAAPDGYPPPPVDRTPEPAPPLAFAEPAALDSPAAHDPPLSPVDPGGFIPPADATPIETPAAEPGPVVELPAADPFPPDPSDSLEAPRVVVSPQPETPPRPDPPAHDDEDALVLPPPPIAADARESIFGRPLLRPEPQSPLRAPGGVTGPVGNDETVLIHPDGPGASPFEPVPAVPAATTPFAGSGDGRVVAVMAGKGGSGKTVIATNLAVAIAAERGEGRVAIVDADIQFGDVALLLQLDPTRSLADLARDLDDLTEADLSAMLLEHESGVRVVPAPVSPANQEDVPAKSVVRIIQRLRELFDVVVVDTPPIFDDHLVTLLEEADDVLVVVDMDLPSVKNAKIALDALRSSGFDSGRLRLLVNRVNAKARLDLIELERSLGLRVSGSVPSDRLVPQSVNEGVPVVSLSPRSRVARSFHALAHIIDAPSRGG